MVNEKVLIPHPDEIDTWDVEKYVTIKEKKDGYIYFSDDDWDGHKIEIERVTFINND